MTTPAMSWYTDQIRRNPAMLWAYRRHKWRIYRSAKHITTFTLEHRTDILEYRSGQLTVRKDPPHPSWNPPAEYLIPVKIRLSERSDTAVREALSRVPFHTMRTNPRAFVNLWAEGFIPVYFTARFRFGGSYAFASDSACEELAPLVSVLERICSASEKYRKLQALETQIFAHDS